MAFNNRRSWRLKFIDIDSSFVLSANESPINGYIVARAPKGNTRPYYFPQGSSQAIDALIGVGSAHWPDILEAQAFNAEYPIYISAPPGTSPVYPSYFGGFYITKNGLYKFHNISDKYELQENTGNAFKIAVVPGEEQMFNSDFANKKTRIIIQAPELEDYTPDVGEPGYGVFEFKNDPAAALIITKDRKLMVTDIDYDKMEHGIVSPVGTIKTYWGDNDDYWTFSGNTATMVDFGIKYEQGDDRNPLRDWLSPTMPRPDDLDIYNDLIANNYNSKTLMELLVNGYVTTDSDDTYDLPFGLQGIISFLVTVKDDTYAYFMQKSPTEKSTSVKISMIGYDKYRYDKIYNYAPLDTEAYKNDSSKLIIKVPSDAGTDGEAALKAAMSENDFLVFYEEGKKEPRFIGAYTTNEKGDEQWYRNVTADFVTQYITMQDALIGDENDYLFHKIFYVESASKFNHLMTEEECIVEYGNDGEAAYIKGLVGGTSAPKNPYFNTMTVSCSEEVYAGKVTSGGEFTGSLDEMGKDTYGSGNYFPEILQDDDVSFLEVRVLKKFGDDPEDLDSSGFWTHKRIVDPYDVDRDGNILSERNLSIEGDRWCSAVMTMNLLQQKTGGIYCDDYEAIIKEGLLEATLPEYDDVIIFMEPTGQEVFKSDLFTLSNIGDKLATVISPKILQPNSRGILTDAIAQKVVVSGRCSTNSNAIFAGEFEVYDSVARKKYWCQPIGDVACNLARIIEKKYGGWAPAWYNIAGDLGGQLKRSVLRSRYQFEDEATKTLDTKGVNPIIYTNDDGLMIISQKTTQDPNFLSDWSYLGHSMSFQSVKREIRDNVMRPQIMKPINGYWMGLRQTQVENILAKRTGGSSPIWSMGTCDIVGQNTPMTMSQRNFVIKVDVRVYVFSETVTLILENHGQI